MWGFLSPATILSFLYSSTHLPEMETNPLKTVCVCLYHPWQGNKYFNDHTCNPLTLWNARIDIQLLKLGDSKSVLLGSTTTNNSPCSRPLRSSSRLWKDREATWGLPHLSAPSSTSSSNLIQRAFSLHSSSVSLLMCSSSSSTNTCSYLQAGWSLYRWRWVLAVSSPISIPPPTTKYFLVQYQPEQTDMNSLFAPVLWKRICYKGNSWSWLRSITWLNKGNSWSWLRSITWLNKWNSWSLFRSITWLSWVWKLAEACLTSSAKHRLFTTHCKTSSLLVLLSMGLWAGDRFHTTHHLMRTVVKRPLLDSFPLLFVDLADVHDGVQRSFSLGNLGPSYARELSKPVTCKDTQQAPLRW